MRVLLVEDDAVTATVMQGFLREAGFADGEIGALVAEGALIDPGQ